MNVNLNPYTWFSKLDEQFEMWRYLLQAEQPKARCEQEWNDLHKAMIHYKRNQADPAAPIAYAYALAALEEKFISATADDGRAALAFVRSAYVAVNTQRALLASASKEVVKEQNMCCVFSGNALWTDHPLLHRSLLPVMVRFIESLNDHGYVIYVMTTHPRLQSCAAAMKALCEGPNPRITEVFYGKGSGFSGNDTAWYANWKTNTREMLRHKRGHKIVLCVGDKVEDISDGRGSGHANMLLDSCRYQPNRSLTRLILPESNPPPFPMVPSENIFTAEQPVSAAEAEISRLKLELEAAEDAKKSLQQNLEVQASDIHSLGKQLAATQDAKEELEEQVARHAEDLQRFGTQLSVVRAATAVSAEDVSNAQLTRLTAYCNSLEAEKGQGQQALLQARAKILELESMSANTQQEQELPERAQEQEALICQLHEEVVALKSLLHREKQRQTFEMSALAEMTDQMALRYNIDLDEVVAPTADADQDMPQRAKTV